MKKSLSLILALAMVFTMFASVAFAADSAATAPSTAQEKFDALKAAGIFKGYEDGTAGLDKKMNRAEFAVIISKVLNLGETVEPSLAYKDLEGYNWAAGFIGAATKAGVLHGNGDGTFAPGKDVSLEEIATVLVQALNLEVSTDAVNGKVSNWAKGYVAAAVKAGLLSDVADFTTAALRSDLVNSTYSAVEAIAAAKEAETATKAVYEVKISADTTSVGVGTAVKFTETATTSVGQAVYDAPTWAVNPATGAVIDASGNFIATAAGTYNVTAKVGSVTSAPTAVIVHGAAATIKLEGDTSIVANTASTKTLTLKALDANGNVDTAYAGTATVALSGAGVTLPDGATYTFDKGLANVKVLSAGTTPAVATTVTATSTALKDASGNLVTSSHTITTEAQVATGVKVSPASASLSNNSATTEVVAVSVVDQDNQAMKTGSYPLSVSVAGPGTIVGGTTSTTLVTAYIAPGPVNVTVSSIQAQSGAIVVSATSGSLTAGSGTINSVTVGSASAVKLDKASETFTAAGTKTFAATLVDAAGNTVPTSGLFTATVKNADGSTATNASASVSGGTITVTGTKTATYTLSVANSGTGIAAATATFTVTADVASKVTISSPANAINVSQANPTAVVTAQITDANGNAVATAGTSLEFTATGGTGFKLNGNAVTTYLVATDAEGKASITFTAPTTAGVTYNVQVDKIGSTTLTPAVGVNVTVVAVPVSTVALTPSATYVAAGTNVTYTVDAKDVYGNIISGNGDTVKVTVPAGMTVSSGLTDGKLTLTNGTKTFVLTAGVAGTQTVTASDITTLPELSASSSITVIAAAQSTAKFFNGTGLVSDSNKVTVTANTPVALTIAPTDVAGNLALQSFNLNFTLSDSNGGQFRLAENGANVSVVSIPTASNGVTVYYVNSTAGSYNLNSAISATATGVTVGAVSVTTAGVAAVTGVAQVETATVGGAATATANVVVTVTVGGVTAAPVNVAVTNGDSANTIATAIAGALTVTGYTATASGATVVLTADAAAANDATLNIAIDGTTNVTGVPDAATSANTTAGVAAVTAVAQVATVSVTGAATGNNTLVITLNGTAVNAAVASGDTTTVVAGKIATALNAASATTGYSATSTGATITLTKTAAGTATTPTVTVAP